MTAVLVGAIALVVMFIGLCVFTYFVAVKPEWRRRRERGLPILRTGRQSVPYILGAVVLLIVGLVLVAGR